MTIVPLQSYLRMHRKRAGFTHDEMAFLCGAMCGTSIARHEAGERLPVLTTALMYQFILGASISDLYEGLFHDVRLAVRARAKGLLMSLERKPLSPERDHKISVLRLLLEEIPELRPRRT